MTVALYCRVSTEEQATSGFSIDHQKNRLQAYCSSQEWSDYRFYIDDGYTGTHLQRPQLQRLLADVARGEIDAVLVLKLDRLSRRQKDVLYLLEEMFVEHNVAFTSATEPFDTATPLGKAMMGMLAVFAELERETIIERTKAGKHQRTRQGLWYGGPTPFGYRWSKSEQMLLPDVVEAPLVAAMYDQFLAGASFRQLAEHMAERDVSRQAWHHKTVQYMLANPVYRGSLHLHGQRIDGTHRAIVDAAIWQAAQQELQQRQHCVRKRPRYLLSGLLSCGHCGSRLKHLTATDPRRADPRARRYYICSNKHASAKRCPSVRIAAPSLERAVLAAVGALQVDASWPRVAWPNMVQANDASKAAGTAVAAQLADVEAKIARWAAAYEAGQLPSERFAAHIRELDEQARKLHVYLADISANARNAQQQPTATATTTLGAYLPRLPPADQHALVRAVCKTIIVSTATDFQIVWHTPDA